MKSEELLRHYIIKSAVFIRPSQPFSNLIEK